MYNIVKYILQVFLNPEVETAYRLVVIYKPHRQTLKGSPAP